MSVDIQDKIKDNCPLCLKNKCQLILSAKASRRVREFYQCENCFLIFVPSLFHLLKENEKQNYEMHQNEITNQGYMAHLNRMVAAINSKFSPLQKSQSHALDFGSGPNPVFANILHEEGFKQVDKYDPFFYDHKDVLSKKYDLITSIEVVEHFSNPRDSWSILNQCRKESGCLLVMTQPIDQISSMADWHYIRDITHVAFYHSKTMAWLADHFKLNMQIKDKDIFLFQSC